MTNIDEGIQVLSKAILAERDESDKNIKILETEVALLRKGLDDTKRLLETAQHERDHYMRQVTELNTLISSAISILAESERKVAFGTYRPNGHLPREPGEFGSIDPVPAFLTEKQAYEEHLAEAKRLQKSAFLRGEENG